MSESQSENPPQPQDGENKTPTKRTPSKRVSRAQRESEELIKNMGGSLDVEGGRKTRSSARGAAPITPATPPPVKKARTSATPRRGRPKKNDVALASSEEVDEPTTPTKKTDSEESNEDKLQENNKEEDDDTIGFATSNNKARGKVNKSDEKSVTDSKVNCSDDVRTEESISVKDADEEKATDKSTIDVDEATAADDDDGTKIRDKAAPATSAADSIEPMDVDVTPVSKAKEPATIEKTPEPEEQDDEQNEMKNDDINAIEVKSSSDDESPVEIIHENSTGGKSVANDNDVVIIEDKIEESKKANDVCSEPKISSPRNKSPGDVVAAQPCN